MLSGGGPVEQAYGHGGVGMVITALTDNVNRAIAEVKTVWRKQELKQAAQGSVLFQFEKRGRVEVLGEVDEEQVNALGGSSFSAMENWGGCESSADCYAFGKGADGVVVELGDVRSGERQGNG